MEPTKDHAHAGTGSHVIHWAPFYDFAFGRLLRRTHPAVVALAAERSEMKRAAASEPTATPKLIDICCRVLAMVLAMLERSLGTSA